MRRRCLGAFRLRTGSAEDLAESSPEFAGKDGGPSTAVERDGFAFSILARLSFIGFGPEYGTFATLTGIGAHENSWILAIAADGMGEPPGYLADSEKLSDPGAFV